MRCLGMSQGAKGKEENGPRSRYGYLAVLLQQDGGTIVDLKFSIVS